MKDTDNKSLRSQVESDVVMVENAQIEPSLVETLTERELEVLRLKAQHLTNQAIADGLVLELSTVKWYVKQIYAKLGVENVYQAIARGQALGLIEKPNYRQHTNLPAQTTPFIGREAELHELSKLLKNPELRLITILAPGGMGKTRLSLALAERYLDQYADGVYMVALAPLSSVDQIVPAIAEATNFPFSPDQRSPRQQLLDFLREKRMLLLLDNFEHLLDGVELVAGILQTAPDVTIIATSRERLRVSGEAVFNVGGMASTQWETVDDALEYDVVQLFNQRAALSLPDFTLHEKNLPHLAKICGLVDGMPLGIVLAAAWTEVLPLKEIADEMQRSFDFLAVEMRDMPRRQWSIRAVFEPTWQRLTDTERDVFMRLAVFRGSFSREAIQAVTGADLRTLQSLINKSLVERLPSGRYAIHELLRQYAEQHLIDAGELDQTRDAHATYYADFMASRTDELKGGDRQIPALNEIDIDFDNIQTAWLWAVEQRSTDNLWKMEWAFWFFLDVRSRLMEGVALFEAALAITEHRALLGWVMMHHMLLGEFAYISTDVEATLTTCLNIALETDEQALMALVLRMQGISVMRFQKDFQRADRLFQECLEIYEALGDDWGKAWALHGRGYLASQGNDTHMAFTWIQQALEIARQALNYGRIAGSLNNIGIYYARFGDYYSAQRAYEECLAVNQQMQALLGVSRVLLNLGANANELGQYEVALKYGRDSLALYRQLNITNYSNYYQIAITLALLGRFAEAKEVLIEYKYLIDEGHFTIFDSNEGIKHGYHITRYSVSYMQGDYETALESSQASLEIAQNHLRPQEQNDSLLSVGLVEIKLGHLISGRHHLQHALQLRMYRNLLPNAIYGFAELELKKGHLERAVELASLVHQHKVTVHQFRVYAQELLAELESKLPKEIYEAAVGRGAALDLDAVVAELAQVES